MQICLIIWQLYNIIIKTKMEKSTYPQLQKIKAEMSNKLNLKQMNQL